MSRSRPLHVPGPETAAMVALQDNLDTVRHFTALAHREALALRAAAKHQHTRWSTRQPDLTQKRERRATLGSLKRFNKTIEVRAARMATTRLWQVVVLVACVEAYLQDVLNAAAHVDPTLMATSTLRVPYAEVLAVTTLEDLASELRGPWARAWLMEGRGPTGWLRALTKMGAPPYPDDVVQTLERMWGIRHVVVHRAGVADAPFLKRHPGVVKAVGERVRVSNPDIVHFIQAVATFVNPTDLYFLKRYPALLTTRPPAPPTKP